MRQLSAFNFITINGLYKGPNEDISWHNFGEDEQKMSDELSNQGNTLIFGRVTYQMMEAYWTSEDAQKNDPLTTKGMNNSEKIVFSKTLEKASWPKTTLLKGNLIEEIQELKKQPGPNMKILGSGQIITQLAEADLIDTYTFMINPLALPQGTPLFQGITKTLKLKLESTRAMKSGNILATYNKV